MYGSLNKPLDVGDGEMPSLMEPGGDCSFDWPIGGLYFVRGPFVHCVSPACDVAILEMRLCVDSTSARQKGIATCDTK